LPSIPALLVFYLTVKKDILFLHCVGKPQPLSDMQYYPDITLALENMDEEAWSRG